jgi:hypothetical protein
LEIEGEIVMALCRNNYFRSCQQELDVSGTFAGSSHTYNNVKGSLLVVDLPCSRNSLGPKDKQMKELKFFSYFQKQHHFGQLTGTLTLKTVFGGHLK